MSDRNGNGIVRKPSNGGVLETSSGAGSAVQSGFVGIDGEFGGMRIVNNKGNTITQYVNQGTGNQEWYINGQKRLEISTNRIKLFNLPTSSAGLTTGDVWNDLGTLKIV
jgi:hypothetical protein